MRNIVLQPEQLLVPGEYELADDTVLKVYFRVFDKGHGADLPPAIVARSDVISSKNRSAELEQRIRRKKNWVARGGNPQDALQSADELIEAYKNLSQKIESSPYYLLDGNHKSAAATLTRQGIPALELQSDKDIAEVKNMIEKGEIFNFNRDETTLTDLVHSFEAYILGIKGEQPKNINYLRTVRERINELVFNGDLPKYMINRYRANK